MCNEACIIFVAKSLTRKDVEGKEVIELGIGPVGVKPLLAAWSPKNYLGLDVLPGPGVDVTMPAERAADALGPGRFDLVLSTEMLEHVRDWRTVVGSMKRLCKPGGRLILTTRSLGYPFHAPPDYWRYEPSDLKRIFSDFQDCSVEPDPLEPGVFLSAVRPEAGSTFADLSSVAIYSMVDGHRTATIPSGPPSRCATARNVWKTRAALTGRMMVDTLRRRPPSIRFRTTPPSPRNRP